MDNAFNFFTRVENEVALSYQWQKDNSKKYSLIIGVAVGVLIFALTLPFQDFSQYTWPLFLKDMVVAIAAGVISTIISLFILELLIAKMQGLKLQSDEKTQILSLFKRHWDPLGTFLFFISPTKFEKTLSWLSQDDKTLPIKMLIAKVIHRQLNHAFDDECVKIHINTYADHSSMLSELLDGINEVCFTIIKSPKNWLVSLDKPHIQHMPLPQKMEEFKRIEDELVAVELGELSEENWKKYPSHYIHFLEKNSERKRRRLFLLKKDDWDCLMNKKHIAYYNKFMKPCEFVKIETKFINLEVFEDKISAMQEELRVPLQQAKNDNITSQDYDVFDHEAMMVYHDSGQNGSGGPVLEFTVGERVKKYSDFLDIIFSDKLTKSEGVYTREEIESEISG